MNDWLDGLGEMAVQMEEIRDANKKEKERQAKTIQDGGLQQRTDGEAGMRQLCVCFLLIQTRFHKDLHDCLITRGGARRNEMER